jgi:hypothetical protein
MAIDEEGIQELAMVSALLPELKGIIIGKSPTFRPTLATLSANRHV